MSAIDFYYFPASAPCRAVEMLARHLNIELNLKLVNILGGEQHSPQYMKLNPTNAVPTIVDDGFVLWESKAILQYLCNKTKTDLYPFEPKKRAQVDRMLQFDHGTLYKSLYELAIPQLFAKQAPDAAKGQKFKDGLDLMDQEIVRNNGYAAGDKLTIADLAIFSGLTYIQILLDYNFTEWKNVHNWMSKLKRELPYHSEINEKPLQDAKVMLKSRK